MRLRPLTVIISSLWVMSIVGPFAQTPNLSGTWRLDRRASQFTPPVFGSDRGGSSANSIYVTHAANGTVTVGTETNGAQAWVYRIGGESDLLWGQQESLTVISRWEGFRLVAKGSRRIDDRIEHIQEVFSLSADGQTLTVEVTTTTADSERTNLAVYTKADSVDPCEEWETPCAK